jgi:hypothetical protein
MKTKIFFLAILATKFVLQTNSQIKVMNTSGNVGIGNYTSDPGYKFGLINGSCQILASYSSDTNGYGGHNFTVYNRQGNLFSISSYKTYMSLLVTQLGVNYTVNGANSYQQYCINGAKYAPYIQLSAEDGSISLLGENNGGTQGSGTYRAPVNHFGVYVAGTGQVGIGTTPTPGTTYTLYVSGAAYSTVGFTGSDKKLKKDIKNLDKSSLVNLLKLQGVSYKLINPSEAAAKTLTSPKDSSKMTTPSDAVADTSLYNTTQFGFIAQDVDSLYPNVIKTDSKGLMAINYTAFIPLIIEKLKELNTKTLAIDSLRLENANIQNQLAQLSQELTSCCSKNTSKSAEISPTVDSTKIATNIGTTTTDVATLSQNAPNPFSQSTTIGYYLPGTVQNATIYVYDMNGVQLKSYPVNARGNGSLTINGYELRSGMYLYTLIADGKEVATRRMILTQ